MCTLAGTLKRKVNQHFYHLIQNSKNERAQGKTISKNPLMLSLSAERTVVTTYYISSFQNRPSEIRAHSKICCQSPKKNKQNWAHWFITWQIYLKSWTEIHFWSPSWTWNPIKPYNFTSAGNQLVSEPKWLKSCFEVISCAWTEATSL